MARRGVAASLLLVLTILAGMASLGPAASAAQDRRTKAKTSKEAWYGGAPACLAIDCSILPLVNPYPENTLHVGISGGAETARTYISLAFDLPAGTRLTGGTLRLPVDGDASHGSLTPEAANMVACLVTGKFKQVRGSLEEPPNARCKTRRSAHYNESKALFEVDLADFARKWSEGKAALALLPANSAVEGNETWHVVLPARDKETEDAPAITATLTYAARPGSAAESPQTSPTFDPPPTSAGGPSVSSGPPISPPLLTGAAPDFTPDIATSDPQVTAPVQLDSEPVAAAAEPIAGLAGPGFAYPIVWCLPLLLLAGFGSVGRALTKELYRRGG